MCKVLLFVDMEFPRGRGDQMEKSWKFQGVGGSNMKPLGKENPGGWGVKLGKPLRGGYGYFLEPHNVLYGTDIQNINHRGKCV